MQKCCPFGVSTSNSRIGGVKLGMCIPQIPVHPLATNRTLRFSSWLSSGGESGKRAATLEAREWNREFSYEARAST